MENENKDVTEETKKENKEEIKEATKEETKEETTVTEKYDDVERIIAEAEEAAFQVYAGQGTLQMRSATYRTSFYSEFIHRTFTNKEVQSEPNRPHLS